MKINALRVEHFRNIGRLEWSPHERVNLIWGENGQGKTSLLESVYYLANMKSFRTARLSELIQKGESGAVITATVVRAGVRHHLVHQLEGGQRLRRLDGKIPSNNLAIYELLRPILFTPDDVSLIKGGPQGRRDLLDRALFSLQPTYLQRVLDYLKVVRHRNQLLRHQRQRQLEPWNEALIQHGANLRRQRRLFLARLESLYRQVYSELTGGREEARLAYRPLGEGTEREEKEQLRQELMAVQEQERQRQVTLAGPQRDDLIFLLDGHEGRRYGSQGQQRSLALAFKLSLARTLEKEAGAAPLLLLDDMTSELDAARQEYLIHFLSDYGGQVMITTTDPASYRKVPGDRCQLLQLAQGQRILS